MDAGLSQNLRAKQQTQKAADDGSGNQKFAEQGDLRSQEHTDQQQRAQAGGALEKLLQ